MNAALWAVTVVLALAIAAAGLAKLSQPKEKLVVRMGWAEDVSPGAIRLIGAVELLGALGLILPAVTGIAPILVPIAATGIALVMLGAVVVHLRRGERAELVPALVLMIAAVFVAWGRYGPYPL